MKVQPGSETQQPHIAGTYRVPVRKIIPAFSQAIRDLFAQKGWFKPPKDRGAVALAEALGEIAEKLEKGELDEAGKAEVRRDLLDQVPVSRTLTHRGYELPYRLPEHMLVGTTESPIDLAKLNPDKVYLWVLDPQGRFLVAEERPDGGRKVNHGDMCPAPEGSARGAARAGGELRARRENGKVVWNIDLSSSFSFNRMDLDVLDDRHVGVVLRYLKISGMDVADLCPGKNTFDAIYRIAGFGHLVRYYLGNGAPK
jgi:hypothetical protein